MIPIAIAFLISDTGSSSKTLSEVSKILADLSKRSAIAVTPTVQNISVADGAKEVDDLIIPLKKDGYATLLSEVAVIYQLGIPPSHMGVLKGLVFNGAPPVGSPFKEVEIPASAIKDNLITFETKAGEAIKVGTLMNLNLPRRIMVSPYYNFDNIGDFPLAITAKDMPSSEFVKALARGLSGKLAVDQKTYTINFDANSFRTNVAKLVGQAQKGIDAGRTPSGVVANYPSGSYSDYQEYQDSVQPAQSMSKPGLTAALSLLTQTLNAMNDQLLEQTFAYKGTTTRLNLASFGSLQQGAVNYLQSASAPQTAQKGADVQRPGPGNRNPTNFASLISRVDPRNPGKLSITTEFRVTMELNLLQGRRRGGNQPQSVDAAAKVVIQVL